ncbi:MAG: hypothetical protein QOJ43_2454 [Gaiellaceae bacterium]|nr:hypothetical protein [Gaiellaceae bacterium]
MIAVVFEAELSRQQADDLAHLMDDARPTRPAGVELATLLYEEGTARLIAYWRDEETLNRYLAETAVPRGQELMRQVGAEPTMRIVEVLDFG